ncbi:MAG: hypothetical protein K2M95_07070 [Clostridiales bacterium]|nr:hypothetical protein [Clostridiales bacterium]
MKSHVKTICVMAVTFALTAVLELFPYVFFIPVLFTCVTRDWKISLGEGLFFGVLSLCYAFISPSPVAIAFTHNPWMPILPRLISVLGCRGIYVLLRKATKNKEGKVARVLPVMIACGAGALLNTATVVPCLLLFGGNAFGAATRAVFLTQTMISAAIEFGVALLVVTPLAVTAGRALRLPDYMPKTKRQEESVVVASAENEPLTDSADEKSEPAVPSGGAE